MSIFEDLGFKSVADRATEERGIRDTMLKGLIPYNHAFLDKVLGGVFPGEVVLIGGETGTGKSELAKELLLNTVESGRVAAGLFLEADEGEMERRWKYNILTGVYYQRGGKQPSEFRAWMLGKCKHLDQYEDEANKILSKYRNLYTFYKGNKFTAKDLRQALTALDGKVQLMVTDHIHYFDIVSDNEQREMTEIMMEIRNLAQVTKIPQIIVAHLRKKMAGEERGDLPTLDDFHGASALQKIANTAILFGSGGEDPFIKGRYITYMQAAKLRAGGKSRTSVVGKLFFNSKTNAYDRDWEPGFLRNGRFVPYLKEEDFPLWWSM